jgi:tripeptide aminopeptidase
MATIPASSTKMTAPVIAWLAHVDTATTLPGAAKPIVHRAYDGRPIVLPDDPTQVLDPATDPDLRAAIGQDIVTASGKTLLGADDKAGVAAIMAAARHLLRHPEISHGKIRLCFTPDEEVGKGAAKIDLKQLGAIAAYTVDGEARGRIENETFSSDIAIVEISGVRMHTGFAKGKLVNSLRLAARFVARLPMEISPETTSGREGFIHVSKIVGDVGFTSIRLWVSDFEQEGLAAKRALVERLVAELCAAEPRAQITLKFQAAFRNPRAGIERDPRTLVFAQEAMRRAGIEPRLAIIRGGTDGSELTARGLPAPNLSAGAHDLHSVREWVSVQDMIGAAHVLLHLAGVWHERG